MIHSKETWRETNSHKTTIPSLGITFFCYGNLKQIHPKLHCLGTGTGYNTKFIHKNTEYFSFWISNLNITQCSSDIPWGNHSLPTTEGEYSLLWRTSSLWFLRLWQLLRGFPSKSLLPTPTWKTSMPSPAHLTSSKKCPCTFSFRSPGHYTSWPGELLYFLHCCTSPTGVVLGNLSPPLLSPGYSRSRRSGAARPRIYT